jgi:hypothetical protein
MIEELITKNNQLAQLNVAKQARSPFGNSEATHQAQMSISDLRECSSDLPFAQFINLKSVEYIHT